MLTSCDFCTHETPILKLELENCVIRNCKPSETHPDLTHPQNFLVEWEVPTVGAHTLLDSYYTSKIKKSKNKSPAQLYRFMGPYQTSSVHHMNS